MQTTEEAAYTNVQTVEGAANRIAKQGVQEEKKPKRKITKPTYLNDYMCGRRSEASF